MIWPATPVRLGSSHGLRRVATAMLVAALTVAALPAQAPEGFRTHTNRESGVQFFYPIDFQPIPLAPTETVMRAHYKRRAAPESAKPTGANARLGLPPPAIPEFFVFVIRATRANTTPGTKATEPVAPPQPEPGSGPDSQPTSQPSSQPASQPASRAAHAGPKTIREAMLAENDITGFEEFCKRRLANWKLKPIGLPKGAVKEFAMEPEHAQPAPPGAPSAIGFLSVREDGGMLFGVVGFSSSTIEREAQAELRKVAKSVTLISNKADDQLEDFYAHNVMRDIPKRIAVRRGLVKGWKSIDTPDYILVYHSDNEKLVNKIARDLQALRPYYSALFPPAKPVETVSIVRMCRDVKEYHSYGGPPSTGGYWHAGNEELVCFDFYQTALESEQKNGRVTTDKDSLLVLYHEAFHQYIYYAVGQISPHDWFNEGHGDFFSGATIPQYGDKVTAVGPSRWRISLIKDMVEGKKGLSLVPLAKLIKYSHAEYYNPATIHFNYAAGWALVYFLRESPEVKKRAEWSGILDTYFVTLKHDYGVAVDSLGAGASLDDKMRVGMTARDHALDMAFKGVDLAALEEAWKTFLLKMKHPWPEDRKP